jgi:hypothetical protein
MSGVLAAETAILVHFQPVRVVFLVLHSVVVALLAFGASQSDFHSHYGISILNRFFSLPHNVRLRPKEGHKK